MNRWLQWRRYLWVYKSAVGGWCIWIFCHGYHWYDDNLKYIGSQR